MFILSTIVSIITIITMWLAGNNDRKAWILGLANQGLWILLIVLSEAWGLLLLTGALIFVYTRNLIRWSNKE